MTQPLTDIQGPDEGADGLAALSRPHVIHRIAGERSSQFRDTSVELRRYETTQLDSLRAARMLTYPQYTAGRHATALWRGAGLDAVVVSRYEEWVSGARGQWVSTDAGDDPADPWRCLLRGLPPRLASHLEALVMGTLRPSQLPVVREALDAVAGEIGA